MAREDRINGRWSAHQWSIGFAAAMALGATLAAGCSSGSEKQAKKPEPAALRDVPTVLRGTVGAEASFRGVEPTLVSGLGIVVGLNGTGGGDLPQSIQTTMERDLARGGIGRGGAVVNTDFGPMSPSEFLRSPNVAVVIVEARIAPGAPPGSTFDVYIRTLPGSGVTSLEGGTLWTTDLRFGPAAVFGAVKARKIGEAHGAIYINPFSEVSLSPDGDLAVMRTRGRVLDGGKVTDPLQIEMVLDNDSFSRARTIVSSINSRFPPGPKDDGQTARGRGKGSAESATQSIAIRVPTSYDKNPAEFLQLLRYMRIDPAYPKEFARQYVEELKTTPGMASDIRWLLQATGKPAIPFLSPMYDYPEFSPRMAALAAGASLGDQRSAGPLIELAKSGPPGLRTDAIRLLAQLEKNPSINLALRDLLSTEDLDVRVAAYDSLRKLDDPLIVREPIGPDYRRPKFYLELVPSDSPMIYITQQGEPRIVIFGATGPMNKAGGRNLARPSTLMLNKPMMVTAWGDRFMSAADSTGADIRVYYRDPRFKAPVQISKAPDEVADFVRFLAHKTTPEEPKVGLDFSYSEVVGALYEFSRQGAISATFATEQDRLRAEIYEAAQATLLSDRPETAADADAPDALVFQPTAPKPLPSAQPQTGEWKPQIIPLTKPAPKKNND